MKKVIRDVKNATFSILLPDSNNNGMTTPAGTGFFISADGWFITAAHVVREAEPPYNIRTDIDQAWLEQVADEAIQGTNMCQFVELVQIVPKYDLAILKVDFSRNANKEWLKSKVHFPYLKVATEELDLGDAVYSYGYPLSYAYSQKNDWGVIGSVELSPRLTSAIVSSKIEKTKMITTSDDPKCYVLDKALNYGNSGGPIISSATGLVHAICSRFQPVGIPQQHLLDDKGNNLQVVIPSLYGVVSRLDTAETLQIFSSLSIKFGKK